MGCLSERLIAAAVNHPEAFGTVRCKIRCSRLSYTMLSPSERSWLIQLSQLRQLLSNLFMRIGGGSSPSVSLVYNIVKSDLLEAYSGPAT